MITGNIKSCEKYNNVHKDFEKVFDYLKNNLNKESTGRADLADGVWVNAPSAPTSDGTSTTFEAHRKYLDIHYIISGKEAFGYSNVESLTTTKEYSENEDYELLEGEISTIILNEGDFCIVFPEDAHIPCMQKLSDNLVRVVAKIKYAE
ncbi:MAG: YhcH/YjgK/YiaL family protein [Roseburia sp.]|nr:YhcH/YjgK/YiaL family protein [Roseburia sp.]